MLVKAYADFHYTELGRHIEVDLGLKDPILVNFKNLFFCEKCGFCDPMQTVFQLEGILYCYKCSPKNALVAVVELFMKLGDKKLFPAKHNHQLSIN